MFLQNIEAAELVLEKKIHMPSGKNPVTYYDAMHQVIDFLSEDSVKNRPSYMCLQCGDHYGEFTLSKWRIRKYRKSLKTIK